MTGYHTYKTCVEACLKCAAICNHCSTSCTHEEDVKMMAKCIQSDIKYATLCYAAAKFMSLSSDKANDICRISVDICAACGNECRKHDTGDAVKHVKNVLINAEKWQLNKCINGRVA